MIIKKFSVGSTREVSGEENIQIKKQNDSKSLPGDSKIFTLSSCHTDRTKSLTRFSTADGKKKQQNKMKYYLPGNKTQTERHEKEQEMQPDRCLRQFEFCCQITLTCVFERESDVAGKEQNTHTHLLSASFDASGVFCFFFF